MRVLAIGSVDPASGEANALSIGIRLGSTNATLKLKGIDGDSHKRWTMWLNSTTNEEPYQD
jgi:hypothetical protein